MCENEVPSVKEIYGQCGCPVEEQEEEARKQKALQKKLFSDAKNQSHFTGHVTKRSF